jgi:hypothetical protein
MSNTLMPSKINGYEPTPRMGAFSIPMTMLFDQEPETP